MRFAITISPNPQIKFKSINRFVISLLTHMDIYLKSDAFLMPQDVNQLRYHPMIFHGLLDIHGKLVFAKSVQTILVGFSLQAQIVSMALYLKN